ncbi:MAG: PLP-dependent transferase [Candidatus Latescibacteria bacterium]|nr:PLP-dependent transferase [Candidatus Latescibacterota bacterium]
MPARPYTLTTRAIHPPEHAGRFSHQPTSAPIYPTSSFAYDRIEDAVRVFEGKETGYVYSRYANPTVVAAEAVVADLEGAETAVAFGSGMAAILAGLLGVGVGAGRTVMASRDLYGGTYALLVNDLAGLGVETVFVEADHLDQVEATLAKGAVAATYIETMSNPLLRVIDVPRIVELSHRYGARVVIDHTFATPYLARPLEWGVDCVVHSGTKYLGGHGDITCGVAVAPAFHDRVDKLRRNLGGVLSPFEAWLLLRGIKTFPLRMRQHCENAMTVARFLEAHPKVTRVDYPGLSSHPDHDRAVRLFGGAGFGGVVAFDLGDGTMETAWRFINGLRLCQAATTLGDVETLVLHPATSSHRSLAPEQRQRIGIGDGLVRMSIGIEGVEDILADIEAALQTV